MGMEGHSRESVTLPKSWQQSLLVSGATGWEAEADDKILQKGQIGVVPK